MSGSKARVLVRSVEVGEEREVTARFIGGDLVVEEYSRGGATKDAFGVERRQSIVTVVHPDRLAQRLSCALDGLIDALGAWLGCDTYLMDLMDLLDGFGVPYRFVQQIDPDVIQFVPAKN